METVLHVGYIIHAYSIVPVSLISKSYEIPQQILEASGHRAFVHNEL